MATSGAYGDEGVSSLMAEFLTLPSLPLSYNKVIKGPTAGTLVGTDSFGNRFVGTIFIRCLHGLIRHHITRRYYENEDLPYARKRWVLFKDTFDYNSTSVSPQWHGWLNGVNDFAPTRQGERIPCHEETTGRPCSHATYAASVGCLGLCGQSFISHSVIVPGNAM